MKNSRTMSWHLAPLLCLCAFSEANEPIPFGVIAGGNELFGSNVSPFTYFVNTSGGLTPLSPLLDVDNVFYSVSINSLQYGLIGGQNLGTFDALLYQFTSAGVLTPLSPLPAGTPIVGVVVNESGDGLVVGNSAPNYLAQVSSTGVINDISADISADGSIAVIDLNAFNQGIFGGSGGGVPYAAFISPSGTVTSLAIPTGTEVRGVSINDSGVGLVGGFFDSTALAVLASADGTITAVSGDLPGPTGANAVDGVAINNSNQGIITYIHDDATRRIYTLSQGIYATLAQTIPNDPSYGNTLKAVAINNAGEGIVGGSFDTVGGFAYLVSPAGEVTSVFLGRSFAGEIKSVAIAPSGAALAGGYFLPDGTTPFPFTYLISPEGTVVALNIPFTLNNSRVFSVSVSELTHVDTAGLGGNDLRLADYINQFASDKAFYFLPATLDGTLKDALRSVAPTRNAIALAVSNNNLFAMNQALSSRSYNARVGSTGAAPAYLGMIPNDFSPLGTLLASNEDEVVPGPYPRMQSADYEIWGTVLGAIAYQKSQDQTPGFEPANGSVLLGFDGKVSSQACIGFGAAYGYSHIHQYKGFGYADVNQGYMFLYGLWYNSRAYLDLALWGGYSRADNHRKIHLTGFDFTAKSHPQGWQLAPHLELGGDLRPASWFTIEPFVSLDWINNWQRSYHETGNSPFNMQQNAQYSSFLRSEAGIRFFEQIEFPSWNLFLLETGAYVNKSTFSLGRVNAFILGSPGSFTVETFTATQNLGLAGFEMLFRSKTPTCPYGSVNYQGEFGNTHQSHVVSLNLYCPF